jgi:Family of unknown function (DUF5320)
MPRFDRTGPRGAGSRTGRGRGLCGQPVEQRGNSESGFMGSVGRGGSPWGSGRGRCLGGGSYRFPFSSGSSGTPADEAEALKAELAAAKEDIAELEARLNELTKNKA